LTPERSSVVQVDHPSVVCHPVGAPEVVSAATRSMLTGSLVPIVVFPRSLTAASQ
jgi:hypothetical protein